MLCHVCGCRSKGGWRGGGGGVLAFGCAFFPSFVGWRWIVASTVDRDPLTFLPPLFERQTRRTGRDGQHPCLPSLCVRGAADRLSVPALCRFRPSEVTRRNDLRPESPSPRRSTPPLGLSVSGFPVACVRLLSFPSVDFPACCYV